MSPSATQCFYCALLCLLHLWLLARLPHLRFCLPCVVVSSSCQFWLDHLSLDGFVAPCSVFLALTFSIGTSFSTWYLVVVLISAYRHVHEGLSFPCYIGMRTWNSPLMPKYYVIFEYVCYNCFPYTCVMVRT